MEKIDPQSGSRGLAKLLNPAARFHSAVQLTRSQRRTTLASGEAAVVLQNDKEQFVISANQFLAGVQS